MTRIFHRLRDFQVSISPGTKAPCGRPPQLMLPRE
jgi:hypothetical protein